MATLSQQLADAQAALHNLQIGRLPRVVVDANGERVEYTATNIAKLQAYIASLQAQISATPQQGPMRSFFA